MAVKTFYVTGSASGTPGADGSTYETLNAAIAAQAAVTKNLVTGTTQLNIECANISDTTAVDFTTSWATNATYYISIYGKESDRTTSNSYKWSTARYRLDVTGSACMTNGPSYTRLYKLQLRTTAQFLVSSFGSNITAHHNIAVGTGATPKYGLYFNAASGGMLCYNNIVYGFTVETGMGILLAGTSSAYNNTVYNCYNGIAAGGNNQITCSNNVLCTSSDAIKVGTTGLLGDYNCTTKAAVCSNYTAGNGTHDVLNVSASGVTGFNFVSVTGGSEDFSTTSGGAGIDHGDQSSVGGLFTDDITGTTRSGTWDAGAYELTGDAPAVTLTGPLVLTRIYP